MDFLIDVDEVLTNFVERLSPIIAGVLNRDWSFEELPQEWDIFSLLNDVQMDAVYAIMERPGFCASFEPYPHASEMLAAIREHCTVYAVTAPNDTPFWVHERYYWLRRHFGLDKHHVVHTHAKHMVSGDFFLDDNPLHIREWAAKHPQGRALLWSTRGNQRSYDLDQFRVHSAEQVIELVRERCIPQK